VGGGTSEKDMGVQTWCIVSNLNAAHQGVALLLKLERYDKDVMNAFLGISVGLVRRWFRENMTSVDDEVLETLFQIVEENVCHINHVPAVQRHTDKRTDERVVVLLDSAEDQLMRDRVVVHLPTVLECGLGIARSLGTHKGVLDEVCCDGEEAMVVVIHESLSEQGVVILRSQLSIGLGEDANVWGHELVLGDELDELMGIPEDIVSDVGSDLVLNQWKAEGDLKLQAGDNAGGMSLLALDVKDGTVKTSVHTGCRVEVALSLSQVVFDRGAGITLDAKV